MFIVPIEKDNPAHKTPWVIYSLITVNSLVFLFSEFQFELQEILNAYGFISASPQLETAFFSIFLHANFYHIIGNMLFLWMYGDNVEDVLGPIKFIILYITMGLIAVAAYYVSNSTADIPLVGASGAISGVLGLYMVFFPHAHVDLEFQSRNSSFLLAHLSAKGSVLLWFLSQIVLAILFIQQSAGVAFSAHIGGFLAGLSFGYYLKKYRNIKAAPPAKTLRFERDRVSDIWCPHCGHKEERTEFKLYECPNCRTKYEVIKSKDLKKSSLDYQNQTSIDVLNLENFNFSDLPDFSKHAHLVSEQDGKPMFFDAYISEKGNKSSLLITLKHKDKYKVFLQKASLNPAEMDDFLRTNTKFVLNDFTNNNRTQTRRSTNAAAQADRQENDLGLE